MPKHRLGADALKCTAASIAQPWRDSEVMMVGGSRNVGGHLRQVTMYTPPSVFSSRPSAVAAWLLAVFSTRASDSAPRTRSLSASLQCSRPPTTAHDVRPRPLPPVSACRATRSSGTQAGLAHDSLWSPDVATPCPLPHSTSPKIHIHPFCHPLPPVAALLLPDRAGNWPGAPQGRPCRETGSRAHSH